MFITLTANINGSIGGTADLRRIDVNLDHVVKFSRDENNQTRTKIQYVNGSTDRVQESIELIEKLRNGVNVGTYSDPGEPKPQNA